MNKIKEKTVEGLLYGLMGGVIITGISVPYAFHFNHDLENITYIAGSATAGMVLIGAGMGLIDAYLEKYQNKK